MKHLLLSLIAATACGGFALTTPARADETWSGGNGTWDFNNTTDWSGSPWTSNSQVAVFTTTPGTVTVDNSLGQVGDYFMYFNSSSPLSAWDIKGGTIDEAIAGGGNNLLIYQDGNSGNVTIDSNMNVDTTTNTDRYNILSNSTSSITLNGNITFGNQDGRTGNTNRSLIIGSTQNSAVFYLNGTFKDSSGSGGTNINLRLAEGGATQDTYFINGDVSGLTAGIQIGSGNVVVDPTAVLGGNTIFMYDDQDNSSENVALYAAQGETIANGVYISMKYHSDGKYGNGTLGAYDASSVTYNGGIGLDNSGLVLTAAANGRATFNGNINNHSPNGLFKTGAGTDVLNEAGGNSYGLNNDFSSSPGTVLMDVQQGTLLINNTSGSAFGGFGGTVKVEAGATLGGSGHVIGGQQVVAEAANSVISPGDAGQANLGINAKIGTLTLAGGLDAESGLTMNFKLNGEGTAAGVNSDQLIVSDMTLTGNVTINLTALDTLKTGTGNFYTLIQDNGDWNGTPNFTVNAPTGYELDPTFGPDDGLNDGKDLGYIFDPTPGSGSFTVELVETPEPSTWAMMIGGAALLGFFARRKMATARTA
jgi:fibronectin-binding autotransporter adhesin